ncbi:hypothetical protein HK097_011544 [Rhizophlyctis rosea]|uniref:Uncharacterized protein n=1 Tax=Rhizophlyctis rosea TaxID=64517 RepID=A0AAD5X2D8_9FUNG|nr:hypothetical protein HK097_011544 [Rhizophlyctis rosea]
MESSTFVMSLAADVPAPDTADVHTTSNAHLAEWKTLHMDTYVTWAAIPKPSTILTRLQQQSDGRAQGMKVAYHQILQSLPTCLQSWTRDPTFTAVIEIDNFDCFTDNDKKAIGVAVRKAYEVEGWEFGEGSNPWWVRAEGGRIWVPGGGVKQVGYFNMTLKAPKGLRSAEETFTNGGRSHMAKEASGSF